MWAYSLKSGLSVDVLIIVDRQAGRNEEAEMYYKRSVELRPDVSI